MGSEVVQQINRSALYQEATECQIDLHVDCAVCCSTLIIVCQYLNCLNKLQTTESNS